MTAVRAGLLARASRLALAGVAALAVAACGADPVPAPPAIPTPRVIDGVVISTANDVCCYRYRVRLHANADLIDTSRAPAGLDLDEFRIDLVMEGERVNPDRERTVATTDLGYFQTVRETVIIQGKVWTREGNGIWREQLPIATPEDFLGQDVALSPSVILGGGSEEQLRRVVSVLNGTPSTVETVNGRQARHYMLDAAAVNRMFLPEESTIPGMLTPHDMMLHLWGDVETGLAIRVLLVAASERNPEAFVLEMDLFDLNDPTIEVTPPPGVAAP